MAFLQSRLSCGSSVSGEGITMRAASFAVFATILAIIASLPAAARDVDQPRTRIIIKKRSFLDAGTTVKPGEARYTNYLLPLQRDFPTYGPFVENYNPRTPLPGPFDLPGYPNR
jgi:hypothetical protein